MTKAGKRAQESRAALWAVIAIAKAKADAQRHLESISLWHPVGYVDGVVVYRRVM